MIAAQIVAAAVAVVERMCRAAVVAPHAGCSLRGRDPSEDWLPYGSSAVIVALGIGRREMGLAVAVAGKMLGLAWVKT
jgi:hypothetical protein